MEKLDNVLKSTYRMKRFYAQKVLNVSPSAFSKMLGGYQNFSFSQQRTLGKFLIEQEQVPREKVESAFAEFNDTKFAKSRWVATKPIRVS